MKKIVNVTMFILAIGAAFAFSPSATSANKKQLASQDVFYNIGVETDCPNMANCSNVNIDNVLCVGTLTTYYDDPETCSNISEYKWRKQQAR